MRTAEDIEAFLGARKSIVTVLTHVASLALPDSWVAAGFIRNAVWDELAGVPPDQTEASDIDILYFDASALAAKLPGPDWQVRNQARMHVRNGDAPYTDTAHAMCHWLETPTAIAARLHGGQVQLLAPLGVDDLLTLTLRPTAAGKQKRDQFEKRLRERNWQSRWPATRVERH